MTTIMDRCKTEGVVDVFQVVKALRVQKPGAVPTVVSLIVLAIVQSLLVTILSFYAIWCHYDNNTYLGLNDSCCYSYIVFIIVL